jgi:hypothetical protein
LRAHFSRENLIVRFARRQVSDIRADASEPMSTQHPLYG